MAISTYSYPFLTYSSLCNLWIWTSVMGLWNGECNDTGYRRLGALLRP